MWKRERPRISVKTDMMAMVKERTSSNEERRLLIEII